MWCFCFLGGFIIKAVISYKYTDTSIVELSTVLSAIRDSLNKASISTYCVFLDEDQSDASCQKSYSENMKAAFDNINKTDFLFVVKHSNKCSEGMLMEVGYALANNKPMVLALHNNIRKTFLSEMTNHIINYDSIESLKIGIDNFNFQDIEMDDDFID